MNLLDLPQTVLQDIFEWLPYDEVAKKREVSQPRGAISSSI